MHRKAALAVGLSRYSAWLSVKSLLVTVTPKLRSHGSGESQYQIMYSNMSSFMAATKQADTAHGP
jgi:hypothetical protein